MLRDIAAQDLTETPQADARADSGKRICVRRIAGLLQVSSHNLSHRGDRPRAPRRTPSKPCVETRRGRWTSPGCMAEQGCCQRCWFSMRSLALAVRRGQSGSGRKAPSEWSIEVGTGSWPSRSGCIAGNGGRQRTAKLGTQSANEPWVAKPQALLRSGVEPWGIPCDEANGGLLFNMPGPTLGMLDCDPRLMSGPHRMSAERDIARRRRGHQGQRCIGRRSRVGNVPSSPPATAAARTTMSTVHRLGRSHAHATVGRHGSSRRRGSAPTSAHESTGRVGPSSAFGVARWSHGGCA